MALTLYFLRHGQTALSRDNMFCGGKMDPELTPDGLQMAEEFALRYSKQKWDGLYCSTQRRALLTIDPLRKAIRAEVQARPELKEADFGVWDGLPIPEVDAKYHDDYLRWSADPAWNAPTGGETAIEISRRTSKLLEEIRGKYKDGNILLVSHKATIRITLCDLLGLDLSRYRDRLSCPVASVSVVEFGSRGPLLKKFADREHMSERLRNLPGT